MNQSFGRVIRHRYDYGAIILLDSRFEGKDWPTSTTVQNLSKLILKNVKTKSIKDLK